jgi:ornithine carbamoyltransferase
LITFVHGCAQLVLTLALCTFWSLQALLDMYTIQREIGHLDNIKVGLVGDLANGRTVRSLAYLLAKYTGVQIYFVAPDVVKMKVGDHWRKKGCKKEDEFSVSLCQICIRDNTTQPPVSQMFCRI